LVRNFATRGTGELYNVKVDDWDTRDDDYIENYLEFKDEEPENFIHQFIEDMTEKYRDYRKVSINKSQNK